jgi:hypothetical protein
MSPVACECDTFAFEAPKFATLAFKLVTLACRVLTALGKAFICVCVAVSGPVMFGKVFFKAALIFRK